MSLVFSGCKAAFFVCFSHVSELRIVFYLPIFCYVCYFYRYLILTRRWRYIFCCHLWPFRSSETNLRCPPLQINSHVIRPHPRLHLSFNLMGASVSYLFCKGNFRQSFVVQVRQMAQVICSYTGCYVLFDWDLAWMHGGLSSFTELARDDVGVWRWGRPLIWGCSLFATKDSTGWVLLG